MSDGFDDASGDPGEVTNTTNDTPGDAADTPGEIDPRQVPWALRRATARWQRRGYTVRYSDAFLTQLVRRTGMGWIGWAQLLLALPLVGIALWLLVRALRRRGWHVVSLTITPDGRVISHRQWTRVEPT